MTDSVPTDPDQALRLLLAGNRRFVLGRREHPNQDADRRTAVAPGQRPFAVLFGCSDSRLAAEIIFDRGLGDLFVVRTAGHVVGPEVLGSIEYGIAILDVPLVAVLGHDSCGGVAAALQVARDGEMPPGAIGSVVERVLPSVLAAGGGETDPDVAGEEHVVMAWPISADGRKQHAGAAVVSASGEVLAVARVLMIEPREGGQP